MTGAGTDHVADVVVVGARCAGAATALLLARAGLDVLVLDRAPYGSDTLSTHAVMRAGVLQLGRWDVLDRIAAETPAIRETTFDYGDRHLTLPITPSPDVDALYAPRRTLLDRVLVDAAVDAGARVAFGVSVTDLSVDGGGRVDGVVARTDDGAALAVRAGLVVGADGIRSVVARRVGAPVEHAGTAAARIVYGYWSELEAHGFEWAFHAGASAGLIPTGGGEVCVFAGGPAAPFSGGAAGRADWYHRTLAHAAASATDRLAAARGPAALRAYVGVPGFVRRPHGPGWALVGDAGAYRDPISAHGITDALRDAGLLAASIIAAGHLGQQALEPYRAARDSIAVPMLAVSDAMATHRWTTDEIVALHLRLSELLGQEVELLEQHDTPSTRWTPSPTRTGTRSVPEAVVDACRYGPADPAEPSTSVSTSSPHHLQGPAGGAEDDQVHAGQPG